jgi:hypothetical protein
MDTIGYHQHMAVLAHERGDYLRAAQHFEDAANCYPTPEQGEFCRKWAKEELACHNAHVAKRGIRVVA